LLTCLRDNWEIFAVVLPVEQLEAAPRHRPLMLLKLQTVSRLLLQVALKRDVEVAVHNSGVKRRRALTNPFTIPPDSIHGSLGSWGGVL
jgi:hypothetical protein